MTKEDVIKEAHRHECSVDISQLGAHELIVIQGKTKKDYLKLLYYNYRWYGNFNNRVGPKFVDEKWIREKIKELK